MTCSGSNLIPSAELKEQFLRLGTLMSKPKGTILFRRGDEVTGLFLVVSGKVSLRLESESPIFPTRVLFAGCVVGLPGTVSGNPYSQTAEVTQAADLAFVPRAAVLDLLHKDSVLCFQVMEMLSGEIGEIRSVFKTTDLNRRQRA
jgi:CRP-like cAMP-binding protein